MKASSLTCYGRSTFFKVNDEKELSSFVDLLSDAEYESKIIDGVTHYSIMGSSNFFPGAVTSYIDEEGNIIDIEAVFQPILIEDEVVIFNETFVDEKGNTGSLATIISKETSSTIDMRVLAEAEALSLKKGFYARIIDSMTFIKWKDNATNPDLRTEADLVVKAAERKDPYLLLFLHDNSKQDSIKSSLSDIFNYEKHQSLAYSS